MIEISELSNETIWQQVRLTHPTSGPVNPTSYPVMMAVVPATGEPAAGNWFNATWEPAADALGYYLVYGEIGPGGMVQLDSAVGVYRVWLKITMPTETPVLAGDRISVF